MVRSCHPIQSNRRERERQREGERERVRERQGVLLNTGMWKLSGCLLSVLSSPVYLFVRAFGQALASGSAPLLPEIFLLRNDSN